MFSPFDIVLNHFFVTSFVLFTRYHLCKRMGKGMRVERIKLKKERGNGDMVIFRAERQMINVLFLGPVITLTNCRKWQLPYIHGITLREALISVEQRFSGVMNKVSFIAVNEIQTHDYSLSLSNGDDIALLTKFSGG